MLFFRKRRRALATGAFFVVLTLAGCGRSSLTGTYVAEADRQLAMIDIVQSESGSLTGRLEVMTTKNDGTVDESAVGLSGVRDKDAISFFPNPGFLLSRGKPFSAHIDGDALQVVLPGGSMMAMTRTAMGDYVGKVTKLRTTAAKLASDLAVHEQQRAAQREAEAARIAEARLIQAAQFNLQEMIDKLGAGLSAFAARADRLSVQAAKIDTAYERVTNSMDALLVRQRSFSGQARFHNQSDQLAAAIAERARATEETYDKVGTGSGEIEAAAEQLATDINVAIKACRSPNVSANPALAVNCQALPARAAEQRGRAAKVRSTLAALEGHHAAILARQTRILESSQAIG